MEKKLAYDCYFSQHADCEREFPQLNVECGCWCHGATIHELKTWPEYYSAIVDRTKTFEVRKADRSFQVGHILRLQEFDPKMNAYTGAEVYRRVSYILQGGAFGVELGYCVMGLDLDCRPIT